MKGYTEKDIVTYNNIFDTKDFETVLDSLKRPAWEWGHNSSLSAKDNVTPFWRMDLTKDEFFSKHLLKVIKEKTNEDFVLTRCYANGHTYGSSGNFHTDWEDGTGKTALLYANDTWRQEWGGKTAFNVDGKYHYAECYPNSLVIFPGLIPHRAEPTSRFFTGLRKTVAWKLVSTDALNKWLKKVSS